MFIYTTVSLYHFIGLEATNQHPCVIQTVPGLLSRPFWFVILSGAKNLIAHRARFFAPAQNDNRAISIFVKTCRASERILNSRCWELIRRPSWGVLPPRHFVSSIA